eukprot:5922963-Prymnesium_polylepis.1
MPYRRVSSIDAGACTPRRSVLIRAQRGIVCQNRAERGPTRAPLDVQLSVERVGLVPTLRLASVCSDSSPSRVPLDALREGVMASIWCTNLVIIIRVHQRAGRAPFSGRSDPDASYSHLGQPFRLDGSGDVRLHTALQVNGGMR